jgi:hypothetical protein
MENSSKIQQINDQFRTTLQGGQLTLTDGVSNQDPDTVAQILRAVIQFTDFSPDNDPYGEHDFGSFTINNIKYFWKIDYYDHSYSMLSPDPTDTSVTNRVLTVMLASEY